MRDIRKFHEEYLSNIESINNKHLITPLGNIPKKYKDSFWKKLVLWILIGSIITSFVFATINNFFECWIYEWVSNLFLNLALGLTASLIILLYTERKGRSISFYEQNLDLFKERYEKMNTAFHASFGNIQRNISFNRLQEATDDAFNSFECFDCTINFFEFLFKGFGEVPKPLNNITKEHIYQSKKYSSELVKEMKKNYTSNGVLSEDDLYRVIENGDIIYNLLNKFKLWIDETEKNLYGMKYNNKNSNLNEDKK